MAEGGIKHYIVMTTTRIPDYHYLDITNNANLLICTHQKVLNISVPNAIIMQSTGNQQQ
ncbi:hypothetical protein [Anaerobutyricum hallii]|uniref:hypothetical protein n=1 Tax=Anaerobutyricum hallii TaxID=39488 RepID=UPI003522016E